MIQEKGQLHMYRTENQMERIWMGRLVLEQDRVGDIKTYWTRMSATARQMRKADGIWVGQSMKLL